MPPPKRQPGKKPSRRRDRQMMSVYPPAHVGITVGGGTSGPLNQALCCYAHILGDAALAVAERFATKEWNLLSLVLRGRTYDPDAPMPGVVLAEHVERTHRLGMLTEHLGKGADAKAADLAGRLRALSYLEAWAVIVAVEWRETQGERPADSDAWWTLPYRQARAPRGEP